MKILIVSLVISLSAIAGQAQVKKVDLLEKMEKNKTTGQKVTTTATLKFSSRLFKSREDLTSVIVIIPSGSIVDVLGSDSTYLNVAFEDDEGYIFRRDAVINTTPVNATQPAQQANPAQDQQDSRYTYLENKYGPAMAVRIYNGKIWKGMNSEMVKDSWGQAGKVNREVAGNVIKEQWIYQNTWLYFENNTLVEWGPTRK